MSGLYDSSSDYTNQLRALEKYTNENGGKNGSRLLLAYHYLTCNHKDAARQQFELLVQAQPDDAVAVDLLQMLGGKAPSAPKPTVPSGPKATEADLIGAWQSRTADGTAFQLTLAKDGEFIWIHGSGADAQTIRGVFAIDDGVLAMQPDSGGIMAANVNVIKQGFTFSQVGQSDPPIVFNRKS